MKIKLVKKEQGPYRTWAGCIHNFFYREGRRWTDAEWAEYQEKKKKYDQRRRHFES